MSHRDVTRRSFLKQEFGGANPWFRMKARPHPHAQNIGEGDDRHALMVRHVGAHDGDGMPSGRRWWCNRVPHRSRTTECREGSESRKIVRGRGRFIIAASAVAYGAMTISSLRPRLSPSPGTPKLEYW